MFQLAQFPPEAIQDILAATSLNAEQLQSLNQLMDTVAAVEPIDPSFIGIVADNLGVDEERADKLIRVGIVLKRLNLDADVAKQVVEDLSEAVRSYTDNKTVRTKALGSIDENREQFVKLATRSEARVRIERRRRIQNGTQPAIEEIRTLVQLRPLFEEDAKGGPIAIECLVPAMTLELKFNKDERTQSATFGLNKETLEELIESLQRAQSKWDLMQESYHEDICGDQ